MKTAEEFLVKKFTEIYNTFPEAFRNALPLKNYLILHITGRTYGTEENYPEMMIEFARLHVQEALKQAAENAEINDYDEHGQYCPHVDEDSILNSYPLENIK